MWPALYREIDYGSKQRRSVAEQMAMRRWNELPAAWRALAVKPVHLTADCEYEALASRAIGYDEDDAPCFCAYEYVDTELRSDDDEELYAAVVHAETLFAWLLRDGRWLSRRTIVADGEQPEEARSFFCLGESMPR